MSPSWHRMGDLPAGELAAPRLELHHALQMVAIAVGRALVPPRDDDSHTALTWLDDAEQWVGEEIPGTGARRAGFHPASFALTLGRRDAPDDERLPMVGRTLEDGLDWLRERLGVGSARVRLDFHYEMPPHPVAEGAAFDSRLSGGFRELAAYFANTSQLLGELAASHEGATSIRTWPHHFDMALLLPAGPVDDRMSRTVGVGLTAGDDSYAEPYFYVNAWPRPEAPELPELPHGHWHTEGFFAAILKASDWLAGDDSGQASRARQFLGTAVGAARSLLG